MHKKHFTRVGLIVLLVFIIVTIVFTLRLLIMSPASQAKSTVTRFYSYEQDGNFSDSWNMFHPYMKGKFPKSGFIQDRAHVFIGHFGAETFSYEIGDPKKVKDWRAAKGETPFKLAYRFKVTQNYSGKYGIFSFQQDVYVVQYKKDWVILWDYN